MFNNNECLILCLTEHWRSEAQLTSTGILNFKLISSFCRQEGHHGGSAIFVREGIECKAMDWVCRKSVIFEIECAAAEVVLNGKHVIVISIYRPYSGNIKLFFEKFEEILVSVFEEKKLVFVVGDFNIELKDRNSNRNTLISLINSFNMRITIKEYTRITPNSRSCIDNILTNFKGEYEALVIDTCISDHTAQKLVFRLEVGVSDSYVYRRMFTEENKINFLSKLNEQNWEDVYHIDKSNVNDQWNVFHKYFLNIFYEHFPIKQIKLGQNCKTRCKHFMNFNNEKVIKCKEKLNVLLVLSRQDIKYKDQYNNVKREYDFALKEAKSKYYEGRIKQSDNKNKCMWEICNELTAKTRKNIQCHLDGDSDTIAENYNTHLLNIIPNLLKNIQMLPFECRIEENNQSMFVTPVTPKEIIDITSRLKNKHSSGYDEIPTSIIKLCISEISVILSYIVNNSFYYGIFPDQLKLSVIKPLYKKGDPKIMENYRPISLLSSFSKIFEKAMCNRVINFMNHCDLLNADQHAYIKGKSIQTAVFQFTQAIINHIENNDLCIGMFLDLSKAYDCIDRELLLLKLQKYGIRGSAFEWLESYLFNRKQMVLIEKEYHTSKSKVATSNIGIPQGSITGPVLFLIYINDLYAVKNNVSHITCYADDTNLLTAGKNFQEALIRSTQLFSAASQWFDNNRLLLNKEKTNIMLFHTKQNKLVLPSSVTIDNVTLQVSNHSKFLGLVIEEFLDWSEHIGNLCLKLSKVCYAIRVTSKYLNKESLKIIYCANFESLLRFGVIFWGSDSSMQDVFVLQKKVLRVISHMEYRQSCRGVFRTSRVMTVYGLYIFECLMFLFKYRDKFIQRCPHKYDTRTLDIDYPIHRLKLTEKSPYYMCIKLYNKLPINVKRIVTMKNFKKVVKGMIIQVEPYSIGEYLEYEF